MSRVASPSIDHLAATWRSLDELLSELTEDEWSTPTGCPGWSVQDNVAHLIDYESGALGWDRPEHDFEMPAFVKNPLGEANELGVDVRRSWTADAVLADFRTTTAARLVQLSRLGEDDLTSEVPTPAGTGTLQDMLTLRVMDTWSHEQDIRRAVGRPGHTEGPAVDESIEYFARFLPYVVAKRAGAADGATAVFVVGGREPIAVEVVDGRARPAASVPARPTVRLELPVTTFAALVGGRDDAPDDVVVDGDTDLGDRIVAGLGFLP